MLVDHHHDQQEQEVICRMERVRGSIPTQQELYSLCTEHPADNFMLD